MRYRNTLGWLLELWLSDGLAVVLTYFFVPETAGLSLEEVNELFGEKVLVNLTHASEEEKKNIDRAIEEKEMVVTNHSESIVEQITG
ncbi:hypothetical protein EDD37DRAFT_263319 [Exophiala viscosa]|uniref:Uncharacterized protein n=1 Tax=Exophiala viscosa TaxID=2486360 RepID=A0AAN6E7S9_9EURO|nr:hypothetical protein EDD36DRAFT_29364 [Exophiala viscosa]KAI1627496.1 hypothetical protein EDD37DRAFT_263319 [Exophiala viscosa]